jgi:FkbM family methyltransferase
MRCDMTTRLISSLGTIPLLSSILRKFARRYPEGSTVTIRNGHLAGYRWKRYHRYVNGYWLGIYELPLQEAIVGELKSGDVFYDIGANAGFFSLLASKYVGPRGRVYAFEPLPDNINAISANFRINSIETCELVEAAVTNRNGTIEFYKGADSSMASIFNNKDKTGSFSVSAITLDDFVQDHRPPNMIKMDIEGAELLALQGGEKLLTQSERPRLLIELHGKETGNKVIQYLKSLGYTVLTLNHTPVTNCVDPHYIFCTS